MAPKLRRPVPPTPLFLGGHKKHFISKKPRKYSHIVILWNPRWNFYAKYSRLNIKRPGAGLLHKRPRNDLGFIETF
ncbi:unnamed protein product [Allacma fusca]|uniref:Uncharacterized protein n=1 Tax=Allacma fusca TaxID=39272 RepID=A0A8J2KJD2_9HEXA|nr:unnamed protein product [Allacma fusca]